MPDLGGAAHRRRAVVARGGTVGAGVEQAPDLGDVELVDRPLQRRAAVGEPMIDVGRLRRARASARREQRDQRERRDGSESGATHAQTSDSGPVLSANVSNSYAGTPARSRIV